VILVLPGVTALMERTAPMEKMELMGATVKMVPLAQPEQLVHKVPQAQPVHKVPQAQPVQLDHKDPQAQPVHKVPLAQPVQLDHKDLQVLQAQ
jgi:hypothetical protein